MEKKIYYFVGIKGIGMVVLVCFLKDLGNEVLGLDIEKEIFI